MFVCLVYMFNIGPADTHLQLIEKNLTVKSCWKSFWLCVPFSIYIGNHYAAMFDSNFVTLSVQSRLKSQNLIMR